MFAQVIIIKQHKTIRRNIFIPPCPASLLNIIFQRIGYFIMNYHAYILLVYPHAKSGCCHYDLHLSANKCILVFGLFLFVHLAMVGSSLKTIIDQPFCQQICFSGAGNINYGGTVSFLQQVPYGIVFIFFAFFFINFIAKITSGSIGAVYFQI
ncbi:MAG: hypothetical protein BWX76_00990 [Candidatus Cloacimonetes bacterium ADurb.Bin089]|nr:MAG: hypothetical protein BWX76_00990 [Candidatus Cloacimonetes bacterium ADurb.Bin089]